MDNGIKKKEEKGLEFARMSWKDRYKFIRNNITVEPMVACYIMPSVLASLATQNLNLEKACRVNLGYDPWVCDALSERNTTHYAAEEAEVQQLVANMAVWKTMLQSALPAALMLFIGSWSDRRGRRKPCMLIPIVGEFLTSIGLIVCTYYFHEFPMEVAGVIEALFPAMTGGWFTMGMAIFSYIGDITSVEMRTLRIGVANVFFSISVPIGMALSGVLYYTIGFYGVFSLAATLYVIGFCDGLVRIKEAATPIPPSKDPLSGRTMNGCDSVRDFFNYRHVMDTFKVAFKDGERNRKWRVVMLMVVVMVVIGPLHGEIVVMYLFTRYRFNWNEVDFSLFSTYSMVTNLLGTMVSVGILSHVLHVDDAMIGVLSCMSKILSGFVYAFATSTWVFYLGPIIEILNGTSFIAMRSIVSKLVPTEELGKVNSLFGVCEALMPLVYGPMYSAVYAYTMNTFPGAFFLLGGVLTAPAVFIFMWMYEEHKKDNIRILEQNCNENRLRKPNAIEYINIDVSNSDDSLDVK